MLVPCARTAASTVGADGQVALGIVAAGGPYGIDKGLGVIVDGGVGIRCHGGVVIRRRAVRGETPGVVGVEHLVIALKDEPFAIILESVGYLCPDSLESGLLFFVVVGGGHQPGGVGRSRVVVNVEDAVHAFVDDVVHHLLHSVHPGLVDLCADGIGFGVPCRAVARELESSLHVRIPCDGNADGVETGPFHHGDEFACGHRLPPGCFIVGGCALCPSLYPHVAELAGVGFQGVS